MDPLLKNTFIEYIVTQLINLCKLQDLLNQTLYDEIVFYSDNIRVFVRWLYDSIKESKYGTIWKTLVAYQKVRTSGYMKIGSIMHVSVK